MVEAGPGTAALMDARLRHSPEAERVDTREEPPVWRAPLPDGTFVWTVSGFDAARKALGEPTFARSFSEPGGDRWKRYLWFSEPPVTDSIVRSMFNTDGDAHRRLRALGAAAITPERIARAAHDAPGAAAARLAAIAERGTADLVADFCHPFVLDLAEDLFGYPAEVIARLRAMPRWAPAPLFEPEGSPERLRYGAEREEMVALLYDLLAERRRDPGDDGISAMLACAAETGMDDQELTSTVFATLMAVTEPVTDFLTTALYSLWLRPGMTEDVAAVEHGIDELLRYTTPVAAPMPRLVTRPLAFHGAYLEPGEAVVVHLGLANRDPRRFDAPNRLDLSRDVGNDLAFAHGPHHCLSPSLGAHLCRVALLTVLRGLPELVPAVPLADLSWRPGCTGPFTRFHVTSGLAELPVVFRPSGGDALAARVASGVA
ncbi:cytochrome P450 [Actinocorallia sp. A-T 12471]|uniref:cytochrome P450 n=1 Tax=Actinocorallia sp. A-T 12471 TaxID=3089813 RepID=UPI0029CAE4F6|nr:cytochrome P450 [Actinocorallia sp. A-T 12471]MDX6744129.1 cytochrome P450 [Actinocorallia sp. A-T 12471]